MKPVSPKRPPLTNGGWSKNKYPKQAELIRMVKRLCAELEKVSPGNETTKKVEVAFAFRAADYNRRKAKKAHDAELRAAERRSYFDQWDKVASRAANLPIEQKWKLPLHLFKFSPRVNKAFAEADCNTVGDVMRKGEVDWLRMKTVGRLTLKHLREFATTLGLRLGYGPVLGQPRYTVVDGEPFMVVTMRQVAWEESK